MVRLPGSLFGAILWIATALGPAVAAETSYMVTIGGRPLDATHASARDRDGYLFLNLVRTVRAFDGLLTFTPEGARVTIGDHEVVYHVGQTGAETDNGRSIVLPIAPFVEDGDIFVPVISIATIVDARVSVDKAARILDLTVPKTR